MRFGARPVLEGVNLSVRPGEVLGLSGRNGAGKTTLLRLCAGLLAPVAGTLRVAGEDPREARRHARIGWCDAGERSLMRRLSLRQNLLLCTRLAGQPERRARTRIEALADALGFAEHLEVAADRCSTGLRQRAAVGRALLTGSRVLLLDEPLRGVDEESRAALARRIRDLRGERAVVWVSHDADELGFVADRSLLLRRGRLVPSLRPVRAA